MAVFGQNPGPGMANPNMNLVGYGRRRGRVPFPGESGFGRQTQQPANYNLDLGSLQEGALGLLPRSFSSAGRPLGQSLGLATQLADEENRRNREAANMMRLQFERANRMNAGLTQQEIDLRLGQASDAASEQMLQGARSARGLLGASGVRGGGMSGAIEGQLRLGRMGQIQQSRTGLAVEEAARRAQAANQQFANAAALAEFTSKGPSMLQLDQLNSVIDTGLNAFIGEKQAQAARKASRDNKKGSILSTVAGILPFPK
jgi:hypothetical protein